MDNHERTINFAFFFVQNNLGGKLSGYWKWQIHQSTPKPCWCQILTKARLFDQVREVMRFHHYSLRTEKTYLQ